MAMRRGWGDVNWQALLWEKNSMEGKYRMFCPFPISLFFISSSTGEGEISVKLEGVIICKMPKLVYLIIIRIYKSKYFTHSGTKYIFFLRKFNFVARKMEWKWLRQTIACTSKEKEIFNSRSNFVWHFGELKHVQGAKFINLSPMIIVL